MVANSVEIRVSSKKFYLSKGLCVYILLICQKAQIPVDGREECTDKMSSAVDAKEFAFAFLSRVSDLTRFGLSHQ